MYSAGLLGWGLCTYHKSLVSPPSVHGMLGVVAQGTEGKNTINNVNYRKSSVDPAPLLVTLINALAAGSGWGAMRSRPRWMKLGD